MIGAACTCRDRARASVACVTHLKLVGHFTVCTSVQFERRIAHTNTPYLSLSSNTLKQQTGTLRTYATFDFRQQAYRHHPVPPSALLKLGVLHQSFRVYPLDLDDTGGATMQPGLSR
jgi:hypothetical protein